jgi:hypothetical protein
MAGMAAPVIRLPPMASRSADRTFRWWPSFPIRVRAESFGYEGFSGRSVLLDVNGTGSPSLSAHEFESLSGFEFTAERR